LQSQKSRSISSVFVIIYSMRSYVTQCGRSFMKRACKSGAKEYETTSGEACMLQVPYEHLKTNYIRMKNIDLIQK
jgi:hypothetical protein